MVLQKKTIRLLILEDSQNEAERLVSLFRNAGQATRVHRLTSSDDLAEALKQTWDLLINAPHSEHLDPSEAISAIHRQAKDIPIIQLTAGSDAEAITEALMLGAQDALPQGEDEWLLLVAKRELANLEERRTRRSAEVALREAEKRCQLLLDSSVDAIAYVHDGMHIYANRAYRELFGYENADDLEGMPMIDLIGSADQSRFKTFLKNYQTLEGIAELACAGVRADGETLKTRMHFSPAAYDGEPCIQVVIRAEQDNAELQKLREISSQDPVTGLLNRNSFLEVMDAAVERAVNAGQSATLAYIRVDRFSALQADIGLSDSDQLLSQLATLLRGHFPSETQLARFADDVFTLLQPGVTPQQAEPQLRKLLSRVEGHLLDVAGRTVQTTLSIGVAGLDEKTAKAQDAIERAHHCADQLRAGNALKIFDPADELAAAANRGDIVAILKQALEHNSFRLLFQPIISLRGDSFEHYEVLLRLLDPQGAEVSPNEFLRTAADAGLATRIDRWVILNAIKLLAEHHAKGHRTRLFLHLSASSIQDASLLPWLGIVLKASRLPADSLVFQFCEADAIAYLKPAKTLAQGLAGLGCRVALAQFGCVLNPFNTLRHLDAEFIKIDGSYTQDLARQENQEVLKALLGDLHGQQKQSIVPFVESATVLATLWQAGVNYIQGYYLQGPSQSMDYDFSSDEE
ncbi:EAL domain-containing protein [Pseudomonas stutzeri]|uniref:GGDEF/EAL domain-containing response regulator n=1 Tax=Stutzerimonas stutzeri TaxID=316 RepID=UPI00190C4CD3|nr:EAL domain-containing protein [Stutzerimonas stutzeri]MBK3866201.1 EAL domain-containing protein [Stutzerimonas stutzeri]